MQWLGARFGKTWVRFCSRLGWGTIWSRLGIGVDQSVESLEVGVAILPNSVFELRVGAKTTVCMCWVLLTKLQGM